MLNILVIGTGMYATGRGTNSYGTILPAIIEWNRDKNVLGQTVFVGTNGNNSKDLKVKSDNLISDTGVNSSISFLPHEGIIDSLYYKKAIAEIPRPACAIIVVPDHLHFMIAKDCLNSDLPVLVVKPLTPKVSEAKNSFIVAKAIFLTLENLISVFLMKFQDCAWLFTLLIKSDEIGFRRENSKKDNNNRLNISDEINLLSQ